MGNKIDGRKKRAVGTNMKPRPGENAMETAKSVSTTEVQQKSILEPVLERIEQDQNRSTLEAKNAEFSPEKNESVVADDEPVVDAEFAEVVEVEDATGDLDAAMCVEISHDDLAAAFKAEAEAKPEVEKVQFYRQTPDGQYVEIECGVDLGVGVVSVLKDGKLIPISDEEARTFLKPAEGVQCCERDDNHDGNCDIHSAPGVFRQVEPRKLDYDPNGPIPVFGISEVILGEQPDGSYKCPVTIGEGYWNAVKEWAEADGLTPEQWLSNLVMSNVETYAMPAKGR